jgi:hypothetical protein
MLATKRKTKNTGGATRANTKLSCEQSTVDAAHGQHNQWKVSKISNRMVGLAISNSLRLVVFIVCLFALICHTLFSNSDQTFIYTVTFIKKTQREF